MALGAPGPEAVAAARPGAAPRTRHFRVAAADDRPGPHDALGRRVFRGRGPGAAGRRARVCKKRDPARDPVGARQLPFRSSASAWPPALSRCMPTPRCDVDAEGALWRVRVVSSGARLDAVVCARNRARAARAGSAPCRRAPPTPARFTAAGRPRADESAVAAEAGGHLLWDMAGFA